MEKELRENIIENEGHQPVDVIFQLLNVHTKPQLVKILKEYCHELGLEQKLLCVLIDKKSHKILVDIGIDFSLREKLSFQKDLSIFLSREKMTEESFGKNFSSPMFISRSYGSSLHYDRNISFFRMPLIENDLDCNIPLTDNLSPYIHAALNNVHYHECSNCDKIELSCREKQVIEWVAKGKTNKEIGMILHVSQFTVKNHIANIYGKLNVVNRAQAIETVIRYDYLG